MWIHPKIEPVLHTEHLETRPHPALHLETRPHPALHLNQYLPALKDSNIQTHAVVCDVKVHQCTSRPSSSTREKFVLTATYQVNLSPTLWCWVSLKCSTFFILPIGKCRTWVFIISLTWKGFNPQNIKSVTPSPPTFRSDSSHRTNSKQIYLSFAVTAGTLGIQTQRLCLWASCRPLRRSPPAGQRSKRHIYIL